MKKLLFASLVACLALFTSCGVSNVKHTGDYTGSIYGVWELASKNQVDYSGVHFYLSLSEPRIALAKKGSFTLLDLKDVDVDGVFYTYDSGKRKIRFKDPVWLSDEFLSYNMILDGTFDVEELTDKALVLSQYQSLFKTKTIYTYHRYFTDNN